MANNRNAFSCPAARPDSAWDITVNPTLAGPSGSLKQGEDGKLDNFAILTTTRFSLGYNDWGLRNSQAPPLGMGADIGAGIVKDSMVRKPVEMIAVGDVRSDAAVINFNANLDPVVGDAGDNDPVNHDQCPSNRHNYNVALLFAEGHVESPKTECRGPNGLMVISSDESVARWNNDNLPHHGNRQTSKLLALALRAVIWSFNRPGPGRF